MKSSSMHPSARRSMSSLTLMDGLGLLATMLLLAAQGCLAQGGNQVSKLRARGAFMHISGNSGYEEEDGCKHEEWFLQINEETIRSDGTSSFTIFGSYYANDVCTSESNSAYFDTNWVDPSTSGVAAVQQSFKVERKASSARISGKLLVNASSYSCGVQDCYASCDGSPQETTVELDLELGCASTSKMPFRSSYSYRGPNFKSNSQFSETLCQAEDVIFIRNTLIIKNADVSFSSVDTPYDMYAGFGLTSRTNIDIGTSFPGRVALVGRRRLMGGKGAEEGSMVGGRRMARSV